MYSSLPTSHRAARRAMRPSRRLSACGMGIAAAILCGCPAKGGLTPTPALPTVDYASLSDDELQASIGPKVNSFCGYCHPVPTPDLAPRESWRDIVDEGFKFHRNSP